MRRVLPFLLFIAMSSASLLAQTSRVFALGDDANEKMKDKLIEMYPQTMLAACENDFSLAFESWLKFSEALEQYALQIEYDIKGVKVLFQVFCEGDGTIKNIGYFLRPESRNVNSDEFRAFLSSFMSRFQMPVVSDQGYNHYSKASFPVHTVSYNKE